MSLVVRDYLRRWAWVYLLGFVCHVTAMVLAWVKPDSVVPASVFAGSAFILMWEVTRSRGSRTFLALPVSSRDLARAWRFVALEFPLLWYFFALIVSVVIVAIFGLEKSGAAGMPILTGERFAILTLLQTITLGTVFFGFTGIPVNQCHLVGWRAKVNGALYGMVWGFSVPAVVLVTQHVPESFADFDNRHWSVLAVGLFFTLLGWSRSEDLVVRRAHFLQGDSSKNSNGDGAKSDTASIRASLAGPSGLRVNFIQFTTTTGPFGLLILMINIGMTEWMMRGQKGGGGGATVTQDQIAFFMPIFSLIAGLTFVNQLRVLKALPISRKALAALLVLWPLSVGTIFGLAAVAVHALWYGGTLPWQNFLRGVLAVGLMLIALPLILRFGLGWKSFLVVFILLPVIQLTEIAARETESAWLGALQVHGVWNFVIALLAAAIAWWFACRVLRSSHPWREGAMRLKSQRRF